MPISNFLAQKENDHLVGNATFTPASTLYMALCTAEPTASSTGSTITETGYTSYVRVSVTSSDFNSASGLNMTNSQAITWPTNTGTSVNNISYWALCSASSGGDLYQWGDIGGAPITVDNGQDVNIPIGSLTLSRA
jgi:hypothetical protein